YPDDGPDGFYPSIPGERLNVIRAADGSDAVSGAVSLRGVTSTGASTDGYEPKQLQIEPFNVSVDVPAFQPDGIYATRTRPVDPQGGLNGGTPVPTPATLIDPRLPYRDFAPDDLGTDINFPPQNFGINDRPSRVVVFVDENHHG